MHIHLSTVASFLSAPDVTLTAEQLTGRFVADWRVDMADCSVIIEEKTDEPPFRRRSLHYPTIQLESVELDHQSQLRVLWLTRTANITSAGGEYDKTDHVVATDEFFQRHPGIDGVVVAHKDDTKVSARLSVNRYSQRSPGLAASSFAIRLKYARYLPIEFPDDIVPGVVSGAQPKLLLHRNAGGTYSSPRRSPAQLKERMDAAADIVTQLGAYFQRKKTENPDWVDEKNLERIRRGLQAKAIDGKWPFSQAEQRWIMARLRELCFCVD